MRQQNQVEVKLGCKTAGFAKNLLVAIAKHAMATDTKMTGRNLENHLATGESNGGDKEDNEDGICECSCYDENCLMKVLMHHADKRMKQETQISSVKRKNLALDGKSKRDESRQEEPFVEIGRDGTISEKDNDNNMEMKTHDNEETQNANWKQKCYSAREERDARYDKCINFEKARKAETENAVKELKVLKEEKTELITRMEEAVKEKERRAGLCLKSE